MLYIPWRGSKTNKKTRAIFLVPLSPPPPPKLRFFLWYFHPPPPPSVAPSLRPSLRPVASQVTELSGALAEALRLRQADSERPTRSEGFGSPEERRRLAPFLFPFPFLVGRVPLLE